MAVDIFIPCYIDQLFPDTGFNMVKVLRKAGVEVVYNPAQTCCGQPAFNAGFWKEARKVSEKFVRDFDTDRDIVSPSGSCVGYVRSYYGELFANSSIHNECKAVQQHMYELSEYLVKVLKKTDFGAVLEGKATYHDACGALRECKIKDEPRALLRNVKGLQLMDMEDAETCCGFGGTFSVKFEPISISMAEQKLDNAIAAGAEYIISTDMSCLMHLEGVIRHKELPLKAMHIADVLASGWE